MSDCLQPHGLDSPRNSSDQNTGEGSLSLLQGIFPTQGSNPGLPHCRRILYQLCHKGSPRILEWVAYPFSGALPEPGIKLESPALQADSLPAELLGTWHFCVLYLSESQCPKVLLLLISCFFSSFQCGAQTASTTSWH